MKKDTKPTGGEDHAATAAELDRTAGSTLGVAQRSSAESDDFGFDDIIPDTLAREVANALKGLARDVTDPVFLGHIRGLLIDHASVLRLRAKGANAELVARAEATLRARKLSFLHTPELAVASRQDEFISIGSRVLDAILGYGTSVLDRAINKWIGPATPAA